MIDWDSDPELKALRDEFVASFRNRREALASIITQLRVSGSTPLPVNNGVALELRVVAHNLAGAAPTYGFESLGRIATRIDDRLSSAGATEPASNLLNEALALDEALASCAVTSCEGSPVSGARS